MVLFIIPKLFENKCIRLITQTEFIAIKLNAYILFIYQSYDMHNRNKVKYAIRKMNLSSVCQINNQLILHISTNYAMNYLFFRSTISIRDTLNSIIISRDYETQRISNHSNISGIDHINLIMRYIIDRNIRFDFHKYNNFLFRVMCYYEKLECLKYFMKYTIKLYDSTINISDMRYYANCVDYVNRLNKTYKWLTITNGNRKYVSASDLLYDPNLLQ